MINVAFAADDNYAVPVTVAMTSLLINKKDEINLYLLYIKGKFSIKNQERLKRQINKLGSTIHFVVLNPEELLDFPILRHGLSAYLRIYSPFLIKDIDKLLYLDCDIIVRKPLDSLYFSDIENSEFAAVADIVDSKEKDHLCNIGYSYNRPYVNTGVLLLNFKKLRNNDLKGMMFPYVSKYKEYIKYSDQDVINCLWEKINILPPKYNLMNSLTTGFSLDDSPWSEEEIKEALDDPYVIHYSNMFKPWYWGTRHKYKKEWYKYLKYTHYSNSYTVFDVKIISKLIKLYTKSLISRLCIVVSKYI